MVYSPPINNTLDLSGSFTRGMGIANDIIQNRLRQQQLNQNYDIQNRQVALQEQAAIRQRQQQQAFQQLTLEAYRKPDEILPMLYARDPQAASKISDDLQRRYASQYDSINLLTNADAKNKQAIYDLVKPDLERQFPEIEFGDKYSIDLQKSLKNQASVIKTKLDKTLQFKDTAQGIIGFDPRTGEGTQTGFAIAPRASTVVNVGGEQPAFRKKLEEEYGKGLAEYMSKVQDEADNAAQTKEYLNLQKQSLSNISTTGPLDSTKILVGNLANQLGLEIDLSKVTNLEQLSAAGNTITIPLVKKLGYNPTDADARLIGSTIANIGKGKATNLQLVNLLEQAADKQIEKAAIVDDLRSQGREGEIRRALREYDKNNPIKLLSPEKQTGKVEFLGFEEE